MFEEFAAAPLRHPGAPPCRGPSGPAPPATGLASSRPAASPRGMGGCPSLAGLAGEDGAFDGEELLVDLAEGDLDVAQASNHAADTPSRSRGKRHPRRRSSNDRTADTVDEIERIVI